MTRYYWFFFALILALGRFAQLCALYMMDTPLGGPLVSNYNQCRKHKMERAPRKDGRDKPRIRKRENIGPYIRKRQPLADPAHDFVIRRAEDKVEERKDKRNDLDYGIALAPDEFRDSPKDEGHRHDQANLGIQRVPDKAIVVRN